METVPYTCVVHLLYVYFQFHFQHAAVMSLCLSCFIEIVSLLVHSQNFGGSFLIFADPISKSTIYCSES